MMVHTPRNNFKVSMGGLKKVPGYLECVDALYEVADAELNSDKAVHDEWDRLAAKHKTFRRSFTRFIRPLILAMNRRDTLNVKGDDIDTITDQIYDDWRKAHDK